MLLINNYFAIMFLATLIFYIINFGCHESSCKPLMCNYSCGNKNTICIKNGSLFIYNLHIHHWILGSFILLLFSFLSHSNFKSIIMGLASMAVIDGLCFDDRFSLKEEQPNIN